MLIKDILSLLTEYNSSQTNGTLAYNGGNKASGKNFDNIITGKADPYKNNEYETKYEKLFPAVGKLVKKLKDGAIKGDVIINGPALLEIQKLLTTYNPRQTPEGDYSLPFGDNIRLKMRGNFYYIGFKNNIPPSNPISDLQLTK
jgi:hypothetical protein